MPPPGTHNYYALKVHNSIKDTARQGHSPALQCPLSVAQIHRPVLDGFGDVLGLDLFAAVQVGYGSRNL